MLSLCICQVPVCLEYSTSGWLSRTAALRYLWFSTGGPWNNVGNLAALQRGVAQKDEEYAGLTLAYLWRAVELSQARRLYEQVLVVAPQDAHTLALLIAFRLQRIEPRVGSITSD